MKDTADVTTTPFYGLSGDTRDAKDQFIKAFERRDMDFINRYFDHYGKAILNERILLKFHYCRSIPALEFAIQLGFNIKSGDDYDAWNVLHWAAYRGSLEVVKYVWEKYPELRTSITGRTGRYFALNGYENALICAVRGDQPEVCRFMLEQNVLDVNAAAAMGKTALHWALLHTYYECALLLLSHGGDLFLKTEYTKTPLEMYSPESSTSNKPQRDAMTEKLRQIALMQGEEKRRTIEEELAKIPVRSSGCTIL